MGAWIRFVGQGSTSAPLEMGINIHVTASEPVAWGMTIVAGNSQPTPKDQGEIQCGMPFTLEVDAQDSFGNRFVIWLCTCATGICLLCWATKLDVHHRLL